MHGRADARLAFEPEVAAQTLRDDAMRDEQAEAGGAMVTAGGEERIKSLTFDLGRHAASIVGNEELDMIASNCAQRDIDRSRSIARESMGHGIDGEIGKNLSKLPWVAVHLQIRLATHV